MSVIGKRSIVALLSCCFLTSAASAAVEKGTHVFGFTNGVSIGIGRLGRIADTGISFSLSYRYHPVAPLSLGLEVRRIDYGTKTSGNSRSDVELDSYSLIGRWDPRAASDLRPYLALGVSTNRFQRKDSNSIQNKDHSGIKPGGSISLGLDRDFGNNWTVGGQVRYLHVGSKIDAIGIRLAIGFRLR